MKKEEEGVPEKAPETLSGSGYNKMFQASTSLQTARMGPWGFELSALQRDCNPSKITSAWQAPGTSAFQGGRQLSQHLKGL